MRTRTALLLIPFLPLCWLGMQVVHELGHVLGGIITGGTVTRVVLFPLSISRTDVTPNPIPLVEIWGGPIVGVLFHLVSWVFIRRLKLSWEFLLRFFAGFCLVSNGAYLGCGSFLSIGDAGELLRHGSPIWTLWLFGFVSITLGFAMWNGQGKAFGLGKDPQPVSIRLSFACFLFLVTLAGAEFLWSPVD